MVKSVSIYELANMFKHKYVLIPERNGERFNCCEYDNDTLTLLDWKPKYSVDEYVKKFLKLHE